MKYIKATFYLLVGIVFSLIYWVISLPITLFTMPVDLWNRALYGKTQKQLHIKDLGEEVIITLPSGEKIKGRKVVVNGDKKENNQKES